MKKHKTVLIIIFIISAGISVLLPNFGMANKTLVMPGVFAFALWTLIIFAALSLAYFAFKGKEDDKGTYMD